jgi:hypothetical protein
MLLNLGILQSLFPLQLCEAWDVPLINIRLERSTSFRAFDANLNFLPEVYPCTQAWTGPSRMVGNMTA